MTTSHPVPAAEDLPNGHPWWRDAVVYQVYVRSFADSDGDGIGDLPGLYRRLPVVARLGVDAIWLNPIYPSPQADAGYDVADYCDVDPLFGTLADARAVVERAHQLGLRVIMDVVPNHTSDQHPWFLAARAAAPDSRERQRYFFRQGQGDHGELPPNNWQSVFGGSAWSRLPDGWWYLHLFAPEQPDLNWADPGVPDAFTRILRFWLDLGVDGFRVDVAHGLAKDPLLPDLDETQRPLSGQHPYWDRDEVHDIYRHWRKILDEYPGQRTAVLEAWVTGGDRLGRYLRGDELHTAFNFAFLQAAWNAKDMRAVIEHTLEGLAWIGAPATWVLSNHDVVRHPTRYGGGQLGQQRARAAALLMLALPGGAYIYQGEELGLEEVTDLPDHLRQDPAFARSGGKQVGRDGCRVPLPWSGERPPYGFGPPGSHPWLPQPAAWATRSVEAQERQPDSMLALYRAALAARRAAGLGDGPLSWLDTPEGMLAFRRTPSLACAVNFTDEPLALPLVLVDQPVLLTSSGHPDAGWLPPNSATWYGTAP